MLHSHSIPQKGGYIYLHLQAKEKNKFLAENAIRDLEAGRDMNHE